MREVLAVYLDLPDVLVPKGISNIFKKWNESFNYDKGSLERQEAQDEARLAIRATAPDTADYFLIQEIRIEGKEGLALIFFRQVYSETKQITE